MKPALAWCLASLLKGLLVWSLLVSQPALAIMAGAANANPPDRPEWRVDPNLTTSPWAGVGSLSVKGGTYSAVAIGPQHVLTAAHVVSGSLPADIVFNLNYGGDLNFKIHASATRVHPGYGKNQVGGVQLDDIAVITLATPLPPGVPHYALLNQPLEIGATIILVGYGASGDGTNGVTQAGHPAVKRTGRNVIDLFQPAVKRFELPRAYLFDFDDPMSQISQLGGPSLGNDIETMIASGDSGSPAFISIDGEWQIAGINTFQINSSARGATVTRFGALGGGMWLPAYHQWVAASMQPRPAPETQSGYLWMAGLAGLFGVSRLRLWR